MKSAPWLLVQARVGEVSTPCADLTEPTVDRKVLSAGLMPKGHPGGLVKVQCDLTAAGEIRDCISLQDDAGLASAVIQRLLSMRGTPATFKGKPISISIRLNLRFTP